MDASVKRKLRLSGVCCSNVSHYLHSEEKGVIKLFPGKVPQIYLSWWPSLDSSRSLIQGWHAFCDHNGIYGILAVRSVCSLHSGLLVVSCLCPRSDEQRVIHDHSRRPNGTFLFLYSRRTFYLWNWLMISFFQGGLLLALALLFFNKMLLTSWLSCSLFASTAVIYSGEILAKVREIWSKGVFFMSWLSFLLQLNCSSTLFSFPLFVFKPQNEFMELQKYFQNPKCQPVRNVRVRLIDFV